LNFINLLKLITMKRSALIVLAGVLVSLSVQAQEKFNGLGVNMGNLYRMSDAKTRSISPENFNGEKGKGGMATTGTWPGMESEPERGH
jgi:hypothetical protein